MSASRAPRPRPTTRVFTLWALGVALVLASVVSVWASSNPDGLEFVALTFGFGDSAVDSAAAASPLAGYTVAGLEGSGWSVVIVGLAGCALTFTLAWLLSRLAGRRRRTVRSEQEPIPAPNE